MSWSRNARLFPFEKDAYLPILDIVKVLTEELGYTGYISFELFNRSMSEAGENVPEEHAARGARSWRMLCKVMGWDTGNELLDVEGECQGAKIELSDTLTRRRSSGNGEVVSQGRIELAPSKL